MNIIFVCRQNIGRSQIAQALYEKYTSYKSASYGTIVEIENQPIKEVVTLPYLFPKMLALGCDISSAKRNQLKEEYIVDADKIIVMAEKDTWPLFLQNSKQVEFWEIEDPINADSHTYDLIISQIHEKVKLLVSQKA
ncbi:MAG: hypothetical protein VX028_04505 [Nanoarchaeota archaeon]|nr:hypothetical protein [Nanoarchaeota archaeon]